MHNTHMTRLHEIQWRIQRGGATPLLSSVPNTKNRPYFRRNMVQNASFDALDFNFFRGSMPRTPLEHSHISAFCDVYKLLQISAPPVCHATEIRAFLICCVSFCAKYRNTSGARTHKYNIENFDHLTCS